MGEAKRKLELASKTIRFDFEAPKHAIMDLMRATPPPESPEKARQLATRAVIIQSVNAKFGQQMGRHEGKIWAAWLEVLDDDKHPVVTITRGMLDWIFNFLIDSDLKLPPGTVQWREATIAYMEHLRTDQPEEPAA